MTRMASSLRFNIPIAAIGVAAEKAVGLIVMVMLAQFYTREEVGAYLLVLSVTYLAAIVADLGTDRHLLRICAAEPDGTGEHLGNVLSLKVPTLLAGFIASVALTYLWQPKLLTITLSVSAFVFGRELYYAFGAVMLAQGNVIGRFITGLTGPVVLLAGLYFGMDSGASFERVMQAHIPAGLVLIVSGYLASKRHFGRMQFATQLRALSTLAVATLPLFLLGLLDYALARSGEILLGWLSDLQTVADYGVGFRIVESCRLVVRPVAMVVFPLLVAAAAASDWASYRRLLRLLAGVAGLAGVATGLALIAAAPWIMTGVFGDDYAGGISLLRVFGLTAPLVFIITAQLLLLTSMHLERQGATLMLIALVVFAIGGALTVPFFGADAAAWGSLIVRGFLCIAFTLLILRELRHRQSDSAPQPNPNPQFDQ